MRSKTPKSEHPKPARRKAIPAAVKRAVLQEAGFKCANPACQAILTLDVHHLHYVSDGGSNDPDNVLALCGHCHDLHHAGHIPTEALRSWKMLLLSLNQGFDRRSLDLLLFLNHLDEPNYYVTPDALLEFASLVAAGLVAAERTSPFPNWRVFLSRQGKLFVEAWRNGDQRAALEAMRVEIAVEAAPGKRRRVAN